MEQDVVTLQIISDTLKEEPKASQRKLAENAGMSLGLMNAVLQRFVERGQIILSIINGRKLAYAVTPEGIRELTERGKIFAARTFKIANTYNEVILEIVKKAKDEGKSKVILYGNSYIKFLVAYACQELGMELVNVSVNSKIDLTTLCLIGELNSSEDQNRLLDIGCISLLEEVQKQEQDYVNEL